MAGDATAATRAGIGTVGGVDGEVVLRVERVAAGGDGLTREPSGRVVFVPGGLPGEEVRVRIIEAKRDFARAALVEVVAASPGRVAPPCPHVARGCGGCSWQHVDPALQADLKRAVVAEALARTGKLRDADVRSGPALTSQGFRTSLRLGVDRHGRPGLRGRRRHDVVAVDSCWVAHPGLVELLELDWTGAHEVSMRVSVATGGRTVLTDPPGAEPAALAPGVGCGAASSLVEVVEGQRLRVSAASFFQTRADGAAALVALVREAAGEALGAGPLVDAYGGVGLFATTLADGPVTLVERSASSCADARHNLDGRPATVVEAAVERWRPTPAALVVADPARGGLGRAAAAVLAGTGAGRLVLVSCDPVSLARDAALLADLGYRHRSSTVLDLFPHTPHVEVVSRFDRVPS
jgi:23S rRNA (uracil1939-C5)-methyltransferase